MGYIKNGYEEEPDSVIVQIAKDHQDAVTAYPLIFVNPKPNSADFQSRIDEATAAISDASSGDKYKIEIKDTVMGLLIDDLHERGLWVDLLSKNNKSIAVLSKLRMKKTRTPRPPIAFVETPKLAPGANQGEVNLKGERIVGATYQYHYTTDVNLPMASWPHVPCTRIKCTINNLLSATRYYFAIAAVGKNNQLVFSGYATIVTQ
jgi:hypothetical protein